jgi:integrase
MARRNSFGTIISVGTPARREFGIRWWEGKVRRKVVGFQTKRDAADALAKVRIGLGDGTLSQERKASITFDEVAKEWLELVSANLRSHEADEIFYRGHVKPALGAKRLAAVTATTLLELRSTLKVKTFTVRRKIDGEVVDVVKVLQPRTCNLVLGVVRRILNFAVTKEYLATSPVARLARGKLMIPIPKTRLAPPIADPADVGRLLAELEEMDRESGRNLHAFFALLALSGVRRGEALGLRWSDIDFERRQIMVRRSYEGETTKGNKARAVPLHGDLVPVLKAHKLACPWSGPLVFPNPFTGRAYTRNFKAEWVLFAALARVGLPRIRVHDLRHVFASHFMMSGGDLFVLQTILGHSTPQLTSDTYGHLSPSFLAQQADRVSYPRPTATYPNSARAEVAGPGPSPPGSTQIVPSVRIVPFPRGPGNPEKR